MAWKIIVILLAVLMSQVTLAEEFTYKNISKRYQDVKLDEKAVKSAEMEGECLVGLKELNFKKKQKFDAVAEWTNYRSISLLEHYSPCTVLIIMEVAKSKIKNGDTLK